MTHYNRLNGPTKKIKRNKNTTVFSRCIFGIKKLPEFEFGSKRPYKLYNKAGFYRCSLFDTN